MTASAVLTFAETMNSLTCSECGIVFALPAFYMTKRREDHKAFHCPNGHQQHYPAETEAEKLKKELEQQKKRTTWAESQAAEERARADRAAGELTKLKARVNNGVCPCCQRSFVNLRRHLASKHPDFSGSKRGGAP